MSRLAIKPIINTLVKTLMLGLAFSLANPIFASGGHGHGHGAEEHAEPEVEKGSHNGRLLVKDDFVLELAIFEPLARIL